MFRFLALAASVYAVKSDSSPCQSTPGLEICSPGVVNTSLTTFAPTFTDSTTFLGNLTVFGPLTMNNGSSVKGATVVDGPLSMTESDINNADISGPLLMVSSKVDNVTVLGGLEANNSSIDTVQVTTDSTLLNHATVQEIVVTASNNTVSKACLMNGTSVGSMTFLQNNGEVYVDAASKLGQLSGGTAISSNVCPIPE